MIAPMANATSADEIYGALTIARTRRSKKQGTIKPTANYYWWSRRAGQIITSHCALLLPVLQPMNRPQIVLIWPVVGHSPDLTTVWKSSRVRPGNATHHCYRLPTSPSTVGSMQRVRNTGMHQEACRQASKPRRSGYDASLCEEPRNARIWMILAVEDVFHGRKSPR